MKNLKLSAGDILILLLLFLSVMTAKGQTAVKLNGNTYTQTTTPKTASKAVKTGNFFVNSKGEKFEVFKSEKGKLFINRISAKTGNGYRQYLNETK